MKIECDKCSAKYSIADEKVRGKTFKIRCKKCSNVIIVRDKGVIASDSGAPGADPGGAVWHLAINGETVGPMSDDEVRQRFAAGEIDKDTAIWQEGFDDWLPLGDVDAFSDLPERGEDPFAASANQDDYAAGVGRSMGVAAAAAVAATGTDGPSEPQSPRVSKLTGQRNENSVLFSLDSLQAMATSGAATAGGGGISAPAARAQANPSKGLATSAPSSEGSGLIDIRSLGSMVGSGGMTAAMAAAPQAAADDAALPSFGGGNFGGLGASPLIVTPPPVAEAAPAPIVQQRSNAPLYIMMVVLILAVGGLGAFIVLKKPEEPKTIVQEVPIVAPSVKDDDEKKKDDDDEKKDDEKKDDKDGDEAGDSGDSGGSGDDGVAGDGKSDVKTGGGSSKKGGGSSKKSGGGGSSSAGGGASGTAGGGTKAGGSEPKEDDSPSVDCILDPSKCGKPKKTGGGTSGGGSSSGGSTKPGVPAKLSTPDIKKAMGVVKDSAKSCGSKHGAKPGDKVMVKVSVAGATGRVTKVTPQAPHSGTALGSCVAAAVKSAQFGEFGDPSMGFQYSFTM